MSDGNQTEDVCCENCFFALETDIEGLIICDRDGQAWHTDMICQHWTRQD